MPDGGMHALGGGGGVRVTHAPPPRGQTDTYKKITFAGGNHPQKGWPVGFKQQKMQVLTVRFTHSQQLQFLFLDTQMDCRKFWKR